MKNRSGVSRALIDNWLLELAWGLLGGERNLHNDRDSGRIASVRYDTPRQKGHYHIALPPLTSNEREEEAWFYRERLTGFLHLLDLIVMNDELVYDADWAFAWNHANTLNPIAPLLLAVRLDTETKKSLVKNWQSDAGNDSPTIVRDGALYYLSLSRALGIYYWPSPRRSEFLTQNAYSTIDSEFVMGFREYIDTNLREIISEVLAPVKAPGPVLDFPGFGSSILANCETPESVLPIAMQFRESKECKAFRAWSREMDSALQCGDVRIVAQGLRSVKGLLASIRAELGLESNVRAGVEFQVGISPGLSIDLESVRSILDRFRPKAYHLVFLRNHFSRVLGDANILSHAKRLFPTQVSLLEEYSLV